MRKFSFLKFITTALTATVLISSATAFAASSKGPISQYKGKWVIVSYWADWCHYCMREMPELNRFYKKHKKDAVVIGVNYDGQPKARLNAFSKRNGLTFPMMSRFPIYKYSNVRIDHIPMTFVFNPQGKLVRILEGAQTERNLTNVTRLG